MNNPFKKGDFTHTKIIKYTAYIQTLVFKKIESEDPLNTRAPKFRFCKSFTAERFGFVFTFINEQYILHLFVYLLYIITLLRNIFHEL